MLAGDISRVAAQEESWVPGSGRRRLTCSIFSFFSFGSAMTRCVLASSRKQWCTSDGSHALTRWGPRSLFDPTRTWIPTRTRDKSAISLTLTRGAERTAVVVADVVVPLRDHRHAQPVLLDPVDLRVRGLLRELVATGRVGLLEVGPDDRDHMRVSDVIRDERLVPLPCARLLRQFRKMSAG